MTELDYPKSWTCRNPRCKAVEFGQDVALCPSCRLAGFWGWMVAWAMGMVVGLAQVFL